VRAHLKCLRLPIRAKADQARPPRAGIIEWYSQRSTSADLLARILGGLRAFRGLLVSSSFSPLAQATAGAERLAAGVAAKKWDVVLLGGFLGSVFSCVPPFELGPSRRPCDAAGPTQKLNPSC
jgi:hypothetical protein